MAEDKSPDEDKLLREEIQERLDNYENWDFNTIEHFQRTVFPRWIAKAKKMEETVWKYNELLH